MQHVREVLQAKERPLGQRDALDVLKFGRNTFITGYPGSGKTYVLKAYIAYLKSKNIPVAITASTGIAATHINGVTLHSWSGIGVREHVSDDDIHRLLKRPYLKKWFRDVKVIIIDEISMISGDIFQTVDRILRAAKKNRFPFGGIQVILCGDFFQLPPVLSAKNNRYIFQNPSWEQLRLTICYLQKTHRQTDPELIDILTQMRSGIINKNTIKKIASRIRTTFETPHIYTRLYTHNVNVDAINNRELAKIQRTEHTFEMSSRGTEAIVESLKKNSLVPEKLTVKEGSLVMFTKNNFVKGFVNGTIGTVVGFHEKGYPIIQTEDKRRITAAPAEWKYEEEGRIKACIKQVPLRLAWAITVHKSQGMTLDAAEIDLRNPFSAGMGYVALSRVKTLKGIILKGLNHKTFSVHKMVIQFDMQLKEMSRYTAIALSQLSPLRRQAIQLDFLVRISRKRKRKITDNLPYEIQPQMI